MESPNQNWWQVRVQQQHILHLFVKHVRSMSGSVWVYFRPPRRLCDAPCFNRAPRALLVILVWSKILVKLIVFLQGGVIQTLLERDLIIFENICQHLTISKRGSRCVVGVSWGFRGVMLWVRTMSSDVSVDLIFLMVFNDFNDFE